MKERFKPSNTSAFTTSSVWLIILIILPALQGCRTKHNSLKEDISSENLRAVSTVDDTVSSFSKSHETSADSIILLTDSHDIVRLSRDSTGRIVGIDSKRRTKVTSDLHTARDTDRWFYGLNATRGSESKSSVKKVVKEEKESEQKRISRIQTIPTLLIVSTALLLLSLLIYFKRFKRSEK